MIIMLNVKNSNSMSIKNTNRFTDPDLLRELKKLRSNDIDAFSRLVMKCLEEAPEQAIADDHPAKEKLSALQSLRDYFEGIEEYENCAHIRMIQDEIDKINEQ